MGTLRLDFIFRFSTPRNPLLHTCTPCEISARASWQRDYSGLSDGPFDASKTTCPTGQGVPALPRPGRLAVCVAGWPDIAVLQGAILPATSHAVLTRRHLLLLAAGFHRDEPTKCSRAGSTIFMQLLRKLQLSTILRPSSRARCALRGSRCCREGARWPAPRRLPLWPHFDDRRWRLVHLASRWARLADAFFAGARSGRTQAEQGPLLTLRIREWSISLAEEGLSRGGTNAESGVLGKSRGGFQGVENLNIKSSLTTSSLGKIQGYRPEVGNSPRRGEERPPRLPHCRYL